jgi:type I restriction enzyme, S subunit
LQEEKAAMIQNAVTKGIYTEGSLFKDSGVEWLGEIPTHWEVKKLKYISEVISKGTTPSTEGRAILPSGEIVFLKAENIVNNDVVRFPENYIDSETNEAIKRSQLAENDILIVIAGATIGKVAVLQKDFLPANTNQAVCFIRLNGNENVKFIWYFLQTHFIKQMISLDSVQSAQPNLSMEKIGNFTTPYPSVSEQADIVQYIEGQSLKLNGTIERIEQEVRLLKEYRVALISEAVTGKIDVRDVIS